MAGKRKRVLSLTPLQREEICDWIQNQVRKFPAVAAKYRHLSSMPDPPLHIAGQMLYLENAVAFCKYLVYHIRTAKLESWPDTAPPGE